MKYGLMGVVVSWMSATACSHTPAGTATDTRRRQPTAGKGTSPLTTMGHLGSVQAACLPSDYITMRGHVEAIHKNLIRDVHLADLGHPMNPEAASAVVRQLKGVQSSVWIDCSDLLVLVGGHDYRSLETINRICGALEPRNDTLVVAVNE